MTSARLPAPVTTNRHNPTLESHRPHRSAAPHRPPERGAGTREPVPRDNTGHRPPPPQFLATSGARQRRQFVVDVRDYVADTGISPAVNHNTELCGWNGRHCNASRDTLSRVTLPSRHHTWTNEVRSRGQSVYNSMIRSQEVAKYFIHFNSLKSSLIIHGDRAAAAPATLRAVSLVTINYN